MIIKDCVKIDEDGYFYYCGCVDDVIILVGWMMFVVEIENIMLCYDNVLECGVIGVFDEKCGQVVKVFVVFNVEGSDVLIKELQDFICECLVQYEFLWIVEYVKELFKNFVGKVYCKMLCDQEVVKVVVILSQNVFFLFVLSEVEICLCGGCVKQDRCC